MAEGCSIVLLGHTVMQLSVDSSRMYLRNMKTCRHSVQYTVKLC